MQNMPVAVGCAYQDILRYNCGREGVGCGNFAINFVDLFKEHPYTEKVYVCDLIQEKAQKYSEKFFTEFLP